MKYLRALAVLAALAAPVAFVMPAQAADVPCAEAASGRFIGPRSDAAAYTVDRAMYLFKDSPVVFTGRILSKVAGEQDIYLFKDATGEARLEIAQKVFSGRDVTPDNTVQIEAKKTENAGFLPQFKVLSLEILK